jgi:OFA family oxalate/formate antiporter-like MFS transporter
MNNIRWVYLMAAVLLMMYTGSIYAFSVFAGSLATERGWTMAQVMLAFGICILGRRGRRHEGLG